MPAMKVMKKAQMKKHAKTWKKMTDEEIRLARKWYKEEKLKPSEIAKRLGRDKSVMTRLLVKRVTRKKQGRNPVLTDSEVEFLEKRLDEMIIKADGDYHITAPMLKRNTRSKASCRVIQNALHKRGIFFKKMREKPLLTPDDIKDRYRFAKKYKKMSKVWWCKSIHAYIDGKHFKTYLTGANRSRAAKHATWGAYRSPGKGLNGGYVKPKKGLSFNTGSKSALIMGAVCESGVSMWHEVSQDRWNGQAAADMYKGPLLKALTKTNPKRKSFEILEDNDPTGFKSSKAVTTKKEVGIKTTFCIPKRSPDLSVMDYAIWSEVNRRMRRQEKSWAKSKRETRQQYVNRLRRTATRLPQALVKKSIGDMQRRCQRLFTAKGGYFEEGGRRGC
jgi:hypothetical protein